MNQAWSLLSQIITDSSGIGMGFFFFWEKNIANNIEKFSLESLKSNLGAGIHIKSWKHSLIINLMDIILQNKALLWTEKITG